MQVWITRAEIKDGSGRPLDYEDLEFGDAVEAGRTFTEPAEQPSVIRVRFIVAFVPVRAAALCRMKSRTTWRPNVVKHSPAR